jgi:lysophospholipase L1-like esterase
VNAIVHQVAEEYGILVAPLYLAFDGPAGDQDPEGYLEDGIHTNAAGDAIIADLLRGPGYEPAAP